MINYDLYPFPLIAFSYERMPSANVSLYVLISIVIKNLTGHQRQNLTLYWVSILIIN